MKLFVSLAMIVFAAVPIGAAAAPAGLYVAVPAAKSTKTSFITRSTIWRQQNDGFVAGSAPERPAVLCELVVRQVGELTSFTVAGKAYDADQLARCNAKAKKG